MTRPSPQEIMAFADGELDDATARLVAAWLEKHPAEKQRIAADHRLGTMLRSLVQERTANAPRTDAIFARIDPAALSQGPLAGRRQTRQQTRIVVTAALTLGLAALILLFLHFTPELRRTFWPTSFSPTKAPSHNR